MMDTPMESVNSLRPTDALWRHRSGSTLDQVMACCLTTPGYYYTWTNVDFLCVGFGGTHATPISRKVLKMSLHKTSFGKNALVFFSTSLRGQWDNPVIFLQNISWTPLRITRLRIPYVTRNDHNPRLWSRALIQYIRSSYQVWGFPC